MLINVEPADFFMYRVKLMYYLDNPDPEDRQVRDYLEQYDLRPRAQETGEVEGTRREVMVFGGCYLGKHLNEIGQIQRRAVEVELLTAEVERHLDSSNDAIPQAGDEQKQQAIAVLVQTFNQESSFRTNEKGELEASLDRESVVEAARRLDSA